MKLNSGLVFKAFASFLLSSLFFIPMKGTSQSPAKTTYALEAVTPSEKTDVKAYLEYDGISETYTLKVINPSQRRLKIYFFIDGMRYDYRASSVNFSKPFDLKGADDGKYTFAVQDGKARLKTDVRIKTIHVTQREVRFASNEKPDFSYTVKN
jgi:hypothetical protein